MGGVVQKYFEKGGAAASSAPPLNPPMVGVMWAHSGCNQMTFLATTSAP